MDAAKAAVKNFTSKRGHHTSVEETVGPSVTRETVKPHLHEEHTQAVDREVHQHHHHTTVQPLSHTEQLPEKHVHNVLPTEHREFHHDNEHETKTKLAADLGHFKDSSHTVETRHTQAAAPSVTGEHVHHHVHETVVPVVHKETIQPEVVHTTVPVHETHHAAAQHHGLSALPMKSLDEFKNAGGIITGNNKTTHEEYDGAPRQYNNKLATTFDKLGLGHHNDTDMSGASKTHHQPADSGIGVGNDYNTRDSGVGGLRNEHSHNDNVDVGHKHSTPTNNTSGTTAKPSLIDRLNPSKDTDGDGKRGFLD